MRGLLGSRLVLAIVELAIVALAIVAAVIAVSLSGSIIRSHAAPPAAPTTNVFLTSITLNPEDASGQTTNAPGTWSTYTADPLCQPGVTSRGVFLNQPIGSQPGTLGEISIQLKPGIDTFTLYGNDVFPKLTYYKHLNASQMR